MGQPIQIKKLEAKFEESINPVAALGFIGLSTDRASHRDFCDFTDPFSRVQVFSTRIPFVETATPETLASVKVGRRYRQEVSPRPLIS
jgi:hypothetical protein